MARESLPTELLNDIFSRCSKNDINALRLTNHDFYDIATNHLLEDFVVRYDKHSIERAASIGVEHKRLAKNVKALWFCGGRIENYVDQKDVGEEAFSGPDVDYIDVPAYEPDPERKRLAYLAFKRLVEDQRQMN